MRRRLYTFCPSRTDEAAVISVRWLLILLLQSRRSIKSWRVSSRSPPQRKEDATRRDNSKFLLLQLDNVITRPRRRPLLLDGSI